MSTQFTLEAIARGEELQGKGASRRLRKNNQVPAIVYGGEGQPTSVSIKYNELVRILEEEAFFSSIVTIAIKDGVEEKVIIKALQRHPAKGFPMHADFQRVVKGQSINMSVPVHFEGTDTSEAIKAGATLSTTVSELDISCIPSNIPEYLVVDISSMKAGDSLHLSDIILPEGVVLADLEGSNGTDRTVANLSAPKVDMGDEEEAPAVAAAVEGKE